jgi:hypothetical protein
MNRSEIKQRKEEVTFAANARRTVAGEDLVEALLTLKVEESLI